MTPDPERLRLDEFRQCTQRKLRGVYCPDHHKPPRVKISGRSLREATLSLSGCCDKLMAIANQAISNQ